MELVAFAKFASVAMGPRLREDDSRLAASPVIANSERLGKICRVGKGAKRRAKHLSHLRIRSGGTLRFAHPTIFLKTTRPPTPPARSGSSRPSPRSSARRQPYRHRFARYR